MKIYIGPYVKGDNTNRKINIKIHNYDTWNIDHTLALIIHPMLIQLKETNHAYQLVDDEDVPDNLKSSAAPPKKNEWDLDSNATFRWDWVMDELIWTFANILDENIVETPEDIIRQKNGLRLFGKYYRGLWD